MNELHSREALAGYDRAIMDGAVVTVVGAGMLGNNVVQTLALSGVGEIRVIDFDAVEPSNVTRSPLFRRELLAAGKPRFKARELALAALQISRASTPRVRWATARVEELGLGALLGSGVVVAAVDNVPARVRLMDWTRMLGIPLVESGVEGHRGHVSVFANRNADDPCWRCAYPGADAGGYSCARHAREVVAEGRIPATQALGALFGAGLLAEHAILALHGQFPLDRSFLELDLRAGRVNTLRVRRDPECPGAHALLGAPRRLSTSAREPLDAVLTEVASDIPEPVVRLPDPYVLEVPCERCGNGVRVGRPDWAIERPTCKACPPNPVFGRGIASRASVAPGDPEAKRACRVFGLPPAAFFVVESRATGELHACQLAGGVDDLFTTRERAEFAVPPRVRAVVAERESEKQDELDSHGEHEGGSQ